MKSILIKLLWQMKIHNHINITQHICLFVCECTVVEILRVYSIKE